MFDLAAFFSTVSTHQQGRAHSFYAIMRRFARKFAQCTWTAHALATFTEAEFRFLASSGAAERNICQRDVPSPEGRSHSCAARKRVEVERRGDTLGAQDSMKERAESRQSAFATALAELRAGRIERAEALCGRIIDSTPHDPAAHQLAATIALQRGRFDDAVRWANSSLSLRPDHPPTLIMAARAARAAGDAAQARVWLERARYLAPDRPEPAFLTCMTLIEFERRWQSGFNS